MTEPLGQDAESISTQRRDIIHQPQSPDFAVIRLSILPVEIVALERKVRLQAPIGIHRTPMFLVLRRAVVSHGIGLPALVEGLKVEDVDAPCEHAADALSVVLGSPSGAGLCDAVGCATIRGPAGLAVPDLDGVGPGEILNMADGLG